MATPKENKGFTAKWVTKMKDLQRPASLPLESFLLPTDDPRIAIAHQEMANQIARQDGLRTRTTEWVKCEEKHVKARLEENLGQKRPLTAWQDNGGAPVMPDGSWTDWASTQPDRVLDLMDISVLRDATTNVDISKQLLPCSFWRCAAECCIASLQIRRLESQSERRSYY